MPEWAVNLIVGLTTAVLGFIGGFFTKTYQYKSKNENKTKIKINGDNNNINNTMNGDIKNAK